MKLLVGVFLIFVSVLAFWRGIRPKPYSNRLCQGGNWHRAFPKSTKSEIREFLSLFISCFALSKRMKLKFRPEDKILDVYHAQYLVRGMPDTLELETLESEIKKRYALELKTIWNENITLGDVFDACVSHRYK